MLYGGYDRAGLDAQYFVRRRVADFQDYFDAYAARSRAARRRFDTRLDVAYGPSAGERLDLLLPEVGNQAPAPVQVFIHGGYWQSLDKADFSYIAEGFVPAGAVTAALNYTLAPAATMDEIVRQCRAALAWLFRHAAEVGGDPRRLYISGHSAGGHLVAMLLATDWPAFAPDLPPDLVKGGAAVSGIYDLEPIRLCYLNDVLKLDAAAARRNSPLHLPMATNSPLVLCVGGDESEEFQRQQAVFAARCAKAGQPVEVVSAPGLHHFSVIDDLARRGAALNRAVLAQMGLQA